MINLDEAIITARRCGVKGTAPLQPSQEMISGEGAHQGWLHKRSCC